MAFQARKTREKKAPEPVGIGKPLTPSAAIRVWYKAELKKVTRAMIAEYRAELTQTLETGSVERFFAQDAAAGSEFNFILNWLNKKWTNIFRGFAKKLSDEFVDKVSTHADSSTWFSLSAAGVKEPRMEYNANVAETLDAARNFNSTLIVGISEDLHEKIYNSVMLSLTSPDPEKQGRAGIENALDELTEFSDKRIDLISRDQNAKLYSSLTNERMEENGVEYFKWLHSGGGITPRESHEKMDEEIFEINDPRLWKVGGPFGLLKGDLGPPGWAINCRCRAVPVFGPVIKQGGRLLEEA